MRPNYTQVHDEKNRYTQVRSLTDSAVSFTSSSKSTPQALRPRTLHPSASAPMRSDNSLFFQNQSAASTSRLFQDVTSTSPASSRGQSFYSRSVVGTTPSHRETMPSQPWHTSGSLTHVPPPPPLPTAHPTAPRFQPQPHTTSPISLPLQELPDVQPSALPDEIDRELAAGGMNLSNDEEDNEFQAAEEEALARAMEASVLDNGPPIHAYVSSVLQQAQRTSPQQQSSPELVTPGIMSDSVRSIPPPPRCDQNQIEEDELLARRLAEEEALHDEQRKQQDEALARQLAEQEESAASSKSREALGESKSAPYEPTGLPRYSPPQLRPSSGKEKSLYRTNSSGSPTNRLSISVNSSPTSDQPGLYRPLSAEQSRAYSPNPKPVRANLGELSNDSPINANNFVDTDLLNGVSLNFVAPVIAPYLIPMPGPMPNIISLPYGRCPPLHLQAPNWKHLLTLLARLSGTRIEPTVEAMAMNKGELKLRTVVQCIRTHHASSDWRTILWFTIDHPVPPQMPGAQKYSLSDPSVLPFSYTLSNPPTLLRDGCDTPMSKYYTIPSTDSIPYPTLPISFPNLATYLQAVVRESRRYMGDSSSGMRKLAKMIDQCYPSDTDNSLYPTENLRTSIGFGNMFKRVMGRDKNGRKGRAENDDNYLLVTPFVPDEWGN